MLVFTASFSFRRRRRLIVPAPCYKFPTEVNLLTWLLHSIRSGPMLNRVYKFPISNSPRTLTCYIRGHYLRRDAAQSRRPFITAMSSKSTKQPAEPRPSASVVVVNERNEILLVQRNPQARHFGGVTVSFRV